MNEVDCKIEGNARSKHSYMPHVERSLMHCGRSTAMEAYGNGYLIEIVSNGWNSPMQQAQDNNVFFFPLSFLGVTVFVSKSQLLVCPPRERGDFVSINDQHRIIRGASCK